jgi:dUTP pyrophosphatase
MKIQIKKLSKDVISPEYATDGSAGFDLAVNNFKQYWMGRTNSQIELESSLSIVLNPNDRLLIGCGYSVAIPKGYMLEIRSRSGNALKKGLVVLNSPGTVDSDYRGEVGVILINKSNKEITINLGDKVAQGVIVKHETASFEIVDELGETERGEGGYGSTDKIK